VKYLAIDFFIAQNPTIFMPVSIGIFSLMFLTLLAMVLFGWKLRLEKRPNSIMKSVFPLINFSLYLFKTIFRGPVLILVYISFMTPLQQALKVELGFLGVLIGALNLILYIVIQVYLITSFGDCNPFSDLIHAAPGGPPSKGFINLLFTVMFTLYVAFDPPGKFGRVFIIVSTIFNGYMTATSHL
jgi:hypothetical protein